jgi:hypothetical protein
MKTVANLIMLVLLFMGLIWAFCGSIDKSFARQDKMLCESAKNSRNSEYLSKCACYYDSGDIKCIQDK